MVETRVLSCPEHAVDAGTYQHVVAIPERPASASAGPRRPTPSGHDCKFHPLLRTITQSTSSLLVKGIKSTERDRYTNIFSTIGATMGFHTTLLTCLGRARTITPFGAGVAYNYRSIPPGVRARKCCIFMPVGLPAAVYITLMVTTTNPPIV